MWSLAAIVWATERSSRVRFHEGRTCAVIMRRRIALRSVVLPLRHDAGSPAHGS